MPTVSYKPAELILEDFPHGDTFLPDRIDVLDENNDPVDLSTGYEAEMRIEEKDGTEVVTLTHLAGITLGDGFIEFNAETVDWPSNCTLYSDLQMTTPGGGTETWARVILKMKPTITSPV